MTRHRRPSRPNLRQQFPPSAPCTCSICVAYCIRPGWWTVAEATQAYDALWPRMMLELSTDRTYGVLSPAFRGNEGTFALKEFSNIGCTFLKHERCELYGTGLTPLECRFCRHDRPSQGPVCHAAIGEEWQTPTGRALVARWCKQTHVWDLLDACGLQALKG